MILTHDAEDLMDPDALRWINYYAQWNDFVQIPVLALPTPFAYLSHGVYCDEFRRIPVQRHAGETTAGRIHPLERRGHRLFPPCARNARRGVFESYLRARLHDRGLREWLSRKTARFAPRNSSPYISGAGVRLRRASISLSVSGWPSASERAGSWASRCNPWEYHSARETFRHCYWFWRDRKCLAGNLVTPLANILFAFGASTWAWSRATHQDWLLAHDLSRFHTIYMVGLSIQALQTTIRAVCSAQVYGWRFACGVPIRVIVANVINYVATLRAIGIYTNAKIHHRPLRWVKTEHAYPNRAALVTERRRLRDILTGSQWITPPQLEIALESRPAGRRLGEHLLELGMITEEDLYTALSLQNNLPFGKPEPEAVSIPVTRSLPAVVARRLRVLPFRIAGGELYIAGSELPGEQMQNDIRHFSSLEIRFHLVTPSEFEELADAYLA